MNTVDSKPKEKKRKGSWFKKLLKIVAVVVVVLLIFQLMQNFDRMMGRSPVVVTELFRCEFGAFIMKCTEGSYFWLNQSDWESLRVGEEVFVRETIQGTRIERPNANIVRGILGRGATD